MISIEVESPQDRDHVRALTIAAFRTSPFGHHGEAELIDALREASDERLSLVARIDRELIGHALFTPVTLETSSGNLKGMGLGPMSVAPRHQKRGVGSMLVNVGLDRCFADEYPFVVVLGHPEFYKRFGFQPAPETDVRHGFAGIPQDVFFIRWNPGESDATKTGGRAVYRPAFGPQHEAPEA